MTSHSETVSPRTRSLRRLAKAAATLIAVPTVRHLRDALTSFALSPDGRQLVFAAAGVQETGIHYLRKVPIGGGQPVTVRDDDALGCAVASDVSALYYLKILTQATGAGDFEVRVVKPEMGRRRSSAGFLDREFRPRRSIFKDTFLQMGNGLRCR